MKDESGFSLIELLVSMAILTIIMASLSLALITFLSNGQDTLERDDHSAGAGLVASYVNRDVASAESAEEGGTICSGRTNLLLMRWFDYTATVSAPEPAPDGGEYRAAYSVVTAGSDVTLERAYCRGTTVLDRTRLVEGMVSPGSASADVTTVVGCIGEQVLLTLNQYGSDTTEPYEFRACSSTRTP